MTPLETILIAGITSLAGAIAILWKAYFHPLFQALMQLVETLKNEQPKQTKILDSHTPILKSINATAKATKTATAEHLKRQLVDRTKLADIHQAIAGGACRFEPPTPER